MVICPTVLRQVRLRGAMPCASLTAGLPAVQPSTMPPRQSFARASWRCCRCWRCCRALAAGSVTRGACAFNQMQGFRSSLLLLLGERQVSILVERGGGTGNPGKNGNRGAGIALVCVRGEYRRVFVSLHSCLMLRDACLFNCICVHCANF